MRGGPSRASGSAQHTGHGQSVPDISPIASECVSRTHQHVISCCLTSCYVMLLILHIALKHMHCANQTAVLSPSQSCFFAQQITLGA